MSAITLHTGLEFNHGQACYKLARVGYGTDALIENLETGERHKVSNRELVDLLLNQPLCKSEVGDGFEQHNLKMKPLEVYSLSERLRKRSQRSLSYVTAIRKAVPYAVSGLKVEYLIDEVASAIGDLLPPSLRTVCRWLKKWDSSQSVLSLRRKKAPSYLKNPGFRLALETIQEKFLNRQNLPLSIVYDFYCMASADKYLQVMSISTFRRILKDEFYQFDVDCARLGIHEARKRYRMTMKENGITRVYEVLEIDHTTLDWIVCTSNRGVSLGRPSLAIVQDARSKYIVAAHVSFLPPSVVTVSKVLKEVFFPKNMELPEYAELPQPWLGFGLPEEIRFDNGLENHSGSIHQLLLSPELCIPPKFCSVHTPWSKPNVENTFSRLSRFMRIHAGEVFKPGSGKDAIDAKSTAVLDLETFKKLLFLWIETVLNMEVNVYTGNSPRVEFEQGLLECPPPRIGFSEERFDFYATHPTTATLRHDGVRVNCLSYGGMALSEVRKRNGEKLTVEVRYSPENLRSVFVKDPKLNKWVTAQCTEFEYANDLSLYQHRKIREFTKLRNDELKVKFTNQQAKVAFFKRVDIEIKKGKKAKMAFTKQLGILENQPCAKSEIVISETLSKVVKDQQKPQFNFELDDNLLVEAWAEVIE